MMESPTRTTTHICNRVTRSLSPRRPGHDLHLNRQLLVHLEDGKLQPRIYKVQNIRTETYVDIEIHLREVCCRPTETLREGRGLVSQYPSFWLAPDHFK